MNIHELVAKEVRETNVVQQVSYPTKSIPIARYARNMGKTCYLSHAARETHMHIAGASGTGKTNAILGMIRQDILANNSVVLLDPMGNLFRDTYRWLVDTGLLENDPDRFIIIDPNQTDYAFSYNPLYFDREGLTQEQINNKIVDVVSRVRKAFDAMMDEKSRSMPTYSTTMLGILMVAAEKGLTLAECFKFTIPQSEFRKVLTSNIANDLIGDVWSQFDTMKPQQYMEQFTAARNRLLDILSSPSLKRMFGQQANNLNFKEIADSGKVVLVDLSASSSGFTPEAAEALGRILINDIVSTMVLRQRVDDQEPRPLYTYIDECDLYLSEDITKALDKCRQYGLRMVLAHQHIGQLEFLGERILGSVNENARVKLLFQLGRDSAEKYAPQVFLGSVTPELVNHVFDKPTLVGYRLQEMVSHTTGRGTSSSETQTKSYSESVTTSTGGSESVSERETGFFEESAATVNTEGSQSSESSSYSSGVSNAVMQGWSNNVSETRKLELIPELEYMPTQGIDIAHQKEALIESLAKQPKGHAFLALANGATIPIQFDLVERITTLRDQHFLPAQKKYLDRSNYYITSEHAQALIDGRMAVLRSGGIPNLDEGAEYVSKQEYDEDDIDRLLGG